MKKIVVAPDSFKGTLSSQQVCREIARAAGKVFPGCQVVAVPVADGGEGSVEAFLSAVGGERRELEVQGPFGEGVPAFYGLLDGGRTGVIEMAACAGLPLAQGRLDPAHASTYGVGQLLVHAVEQGCEKIILGLGGQLHQRRGLRRRRGGRGQVLPGERGELCPHRRHPGGDRPGGRGRAAGEVPGGGAHRHVRHRQPPSTGRPGRLTSSAPKRGRTLPWWSCWTRTSGGWSGR